MKLIRWLLLLPATVVVIAFAIANRHEVGLSFDPLPFALEAPFYALGLGFILLGMLIGGLAASAKTLKWRRRARRAEREATRLEGALAAERERSVAAPKTTPPVISNAA